MRMLRRLAQSWPQWGNPPDWALLCRYGLPSNPNILAFGRSAPLHSKLPENCMTALLARVCRTLGRKHVMPTERPVSTQVVSEWPTGENRGAWQLWTANTIRKEA